MSAPSRERSMDLADGLRDEDFEAIVSLAFDRWGLSIAARKRSLVQNRLTTLARKLRCTDVKQLIKALENSKTSDELLPVFDALSTNETSFFRHPDQFDCFRELVLEGAGQTKSRLRVWSAGCSSGCEPYSIAMTLDETICDLGVDARILATDLSTSALARAQKAIYAEEFVADLDPSLVQRNFERLVIDGVPHYRVAPHIRKYVTLGLVNLMGSWKMKGPFDAIFCRNVMIYFDRQTRDRLVTRLTGLLGTGRILIVGSSENLTDLPDGLERIRPFCFLETP